MSVRMCFFALLTALVSGVLGCGDSEPTPILGTLKLDGQPLEGAMVTLVPPTGGTTGAVAQSAADGTFRLIPQGGQSLPSGSYKVVVTKLAIPKPGDPPPPPGSSPIPPIYRDLKTTPLQFEVPIAKLEIELDSNKK